MAVISDFVITQTPTGRHVVRQKGGSHALRTFCGHNSKLEAEQFIKHLVKILNEKGEVE